ncbi:MAG TPA: efflux RND transporter periplasmic adaptor subunit [Candidatus Dormibacteraeota bacterium]|nr:efflux RND transporter periplasmic adaptor subunit [Candidatus Dormibacteraeota bacterium]
MKLRKKIQLGVMLAVLLVAGVGGAAALQALRRPDRETPTTRVRRGTLAVNVYTLGELRPNRTSMMIAPQVAGALQIVQLARTSTIVNAGDVVVEFDPSEQEFNLEQSRSMLQQAEQQITKKQSDTAVQAAQDQVALLKAKYAVRRAELDVKRNELVSSIDAKKNDLTLEESKRHLEQLEQDIDSRKASNQASLAVVQEQRNKAKLDMEQSKKNIENMTLRAPIAGLVSVRENRDSTSGFMFQGMSLPEYRMGDQAFPGRLIAEVLEVSQMEIQAKVPETARADINTGEKVEVHVHALPGKTYHGKVKTVAGLASRSFFSDDPTRRFDATFQIDEPDVRLRPGLTAEVIVLGNEVRDALCLPTQAVFQKDGKPVVYARSGSGFVPRVVTIKHRTESQIVVDGVTEGTEVALVNPTTKGTEPTTSGGPARVGGASK